MKNILIMLLLAALSNSSCSSVLHDLFGSKTPHEQYADKLEDRGLDKTPEGREWLAVSKKALDNPQTISLPYRLHGYFPAGKARALGLQFQAKQGERITFTLNRKEGARLPLYADLFEQEGSSTTSLLAADTTQSEFSFDVEKTGTYVLRLQPELFRSGEYSLSASVGASLGFPVSGGKAKAGSFWGADRDGGKRRHEGVDIFAPKLTPAVAAADGYITGVREGGIGGKVVWMRAQDKGIYLYYAHLDKQLVQEGQAVKKGDTLGLVGNTGNARYTPSHLHFGVYTHSGPVDPFPFVNRAVKTAPAVTRKNLSGSFKLTKAQKTRGGVLIEANTDLVPLAVTSKGYIAELPDGTLLQASFAAVKAVPQAPQPKTQGVAAKAGEKPKSS